MNQRKPLKNHKPVEELEDDKDWLLCIFDDPKISIPEFFEKSGITPPPGLFR